MRIGKFILRLPVSENSKRIGQTYLHSAEELVKVADKHWKDADGVYTQEGVNLIIRSCSIKSLAAKYFGFSNVEEMNDYIKIHGSIQ